jgi:hypothetical protein
VTPEAVPAAREEARVGTPVTPRPEMGQEATDRSAADAPLRAMAVSAVPLVHDHRLDEVLASRHRPRLPPALLVIGGAAVFLVGALSIAAVLVRRPAALPAAGSAVAAAAARPGAPLAPSLTASTGAPLAPSLTREHGRAACAFAHHEHGRAARAIAYASVEPSPAVALSASGRLPAPVDVAPLAAAPEEPRPPTVSPPPAARSRAPSSPTVPARSAPDATRRPAKTTYYRMGSDDASVWSEALDPGSNRGAAPRWAARPGERAGFDGGPRGRGAGGRGELGGQERGQEGVHGRDRRPSSGESSRRPSRASARRTTSSRARTRT